MGGIGTNKFTIVSVPTLGIFTPYVNLKNKDSKKSLLTEDEVELLTVPSDLAEYKSAIMEALYKGTKRNIESENDPKNAVVG